MIRYLTLILLLLPGLCGNAQKIPKADSLKQLLPAAKEDTNKVLLLINLTKATKNADIAAAYKYCEDALQLSQKLGYNKGRFQALINEISLIRIQGKDSLALEKCKAFVSLAESLKDSFYIAAGYLNLGEVYDNNGDNEKGVGFCLKGLQIAERLDVKSLMQDGYSALQRLYLSRSEFDKAIRYGNLAIKLAKEMNDKTRVATQSYNLAYTYNLTKEFDKSISVSEEVLKITQETGDKRIQSYALYNLCAIKLRTGKLEDALKYGLMSLEISRQNSDKSIESSTLAALGTIYVQMKQYKEAEKYATSALALRQKTEDKMGVAEIKNILANVYFALDQPVKAYALQLESEDFLDSYHQSILSSQSSELEKKYETPKKEALIKLQQADIRQKKLLNYVLLGSAIALLIISLLSYRTYRHKQRLQQVKIDELEKEKQLAATEAVLKGEEQERSRLAKDLHDGLGGMLSGIKHSLNAMKRNLIMTPDNAQAFERSVDMLDSSIKEMRRVAHNMMPETLVKFGLDAALKDFCNDINQSGALQVNYQSIGMEYATIDQTAAITIYRIVQELLNNAMKHASAKNALVQVSKTGADISITVEDDGKGFDTAILKGTKGLGWSNLQSRIEYLKGKMDVRSTVDKGTSVLIELKA